MKYKHVFLLWLWADLILALGCLVAVIGTTTFSGNKPSSDWGMFLLVLGYGAVVSLPSLIAMLIFHYFYNQKSILKKNYFKIYSLVIIVINLLYLIIGYYVFTMIGEFNLLYFFTTLAGFISLYVVRLKIRKEEKASYIA